MLEYRHLERYADVLLWGLSTSRKGRMKKGEIFLVRGHLPAIALVEILYARLLEMGMHPIVRVEPTSTMENDFYTRSSVRQRIFHAPGDRECFKALNGSIFVHAPESITHLKNVDPRRIARVMVARKAYRDILTAREEAGLFSWTLCSYPTPVLAETAGLSREHYARQVIRACFLNRSDPVAHWRQVHRQVYRIKRSLDRLPVRFFHIASAHIDLEVVPGASRRWLGVSGRNIPSFEVFISPDWRGTRGVYTADQPSFRSGNRVRGVRLEFRNGNAVNISAEEGEDFVRRQLAMDSGARRLGEFSLTDRRFSRIDEFMANTLYDENYGGRYGNCHVALGAAYSDAYTGDSKTLTKARKTALGFNDSALHWDLVNTEKKRVVAHLSGGGRQTIYENGVFTI
ncbi:MAG: aminopeptidase [Pseudomonadota bacterium]